MLSPNRPIEGSPIARLAGLLRVSRYVRVGAGCKQNAADFQLAMHRGGRKWGFVRVVGPGVTKIGIGTAFQQDAHELEVPILRRGGEWSLPVIRMVPAPPRGRVRVDAEPEAKSHARDIAARRVPVELVGVRPPEP